MPDIICFNGKIHAYPPQTAMAIRGRRIIALGDDEAIKSLAHSHTRRIDLEGRLVLPGFIDAHFHLFNWALGRNDLTLSTSTVGSLPKLLSALQEQVSRTTSGQWIKGSGWNESGWAAPVMPSRHDLDSVSADHPVILWRSDLHVAVANSHALQLAGIDKNYPDPSDGVIERDETGEPTGILKELAIDLVSRNIPRPPDDNLNRLLLEAIADLHKLGITGLHDQRLMKNTDSVPAWETYQRLNNQRQLKLRITANIHHTQLPHVIKLGLQSGFGDSYLRMGFVKMFADGSMGARTAWMMSPYETGGTGFSAMPVAEMAETIQLAHRNGWAVSVHAIGDRANREVLNIFQSISGQAHKALFPHRIEHAQVLHPDDMSRLAELGVTASVQPVHVVDDIALLDRIWGERSRYAFPFRSLLKHKTLLAFGSDCPVASPNPWLGVHAAVTRRRESGSPEGGWYPQERLTVAEAIYGYTTANALAVGQQMNLGTLAPGRLADFIVVDQDVFSVDSMALAETQVLMTVFDGEIVYQA